VLKLADQGREMQLAAQLAALLPLVFEVLVLALKAL
jgi:hypothetical protein